MKLLHGLPILVPLFNIAMHRGLSEMALTASFFSTCKDRVQGFLATYFL
jgi:hypothetical protein